MADCGDFIKNAHDLSPSEAREIVERLQAVIREKGADARLSGALKRVAQEEGDWAKLAALNEKMNAQRQILRRAEAFEFVFGRGDPAKNLEAFLVGLPGRQATVEAGLKSVDAQMKMRAETTLGAVVNDLEAIDPKIWGLRDNKMFNRDLANEMWALGEGKAESVTGNADAFQVAQVLERHKEGIRLTANEQGANIRRLPGHVMAQHHDATRVFKAGKDEWIAYVSDRLDAERTFGGSDPAEWLDAAWSHIVSGKRRLTADTTGRAQSPKALSGKLSASRQLHFKSADDWLEYNDRFGNQQIMPGVLTQMTFLAEDIGLMQRMGPNPEATFLPLLAEVEKRAVEAGKPLPKRITDPKSGRLRRRFDVVSRNDLIPGDLTTSRIVANLKGIQVMSKLGSATISSFNDMTTVAATLNHKGIGIFETNAKALAQLAKGRPKGELRRALRQLGIGLEGMQGGISRRFMATDLPIGTMSKWVNTFMKWNGLNWWTDNWKEFYAVMASSNLADNLAKPWESLGRLKNALSEYGITAEDWTLLQRAGAEEIEGVRYVMSETALRTGNEELADKLRMYFVNEADFAVPTPGARERSIALQGTQRGTLAGGLFEFIAQFKMFPLTMAMRQLPRLKEIGIPNSILLAGQSLLIGYASLTVKDMLRGRAPRPFLDPKTWAASFAQSGGAGILGDLLFQDFRGYKRGFIQTAAGPVLGNFDEAFRVLDGALRAEPSGGDAVRLITDNLPFTNLFYTRTAIDYLFIYSLQEMLNPGYLRRVERTIERENNQKFIVRPSSVIKRGGGFR